MIITSQESQRLLFKVRFFVKLSELGRIIALFEYFF